MAGALFYNLLIAHYLVERRFLHDPQELILIDLAIALAISLRNHFL